MGELVEVIKAYPHAENGESISFDGDFYLINADIRAPVFGRLDISIPINAFNNVMMRVAGRTAEGVLGHGLFTDRRQVNSAH